MRPDVNLEADILAAMLAEPERYARKAFALLEAEDFTEPHTKAVWDAMSSVAKRDGNAAIAPATIRDELRRRKRDEQDVLALLDPNLGLGPIGSFEPKCRRLREIRQARFVNESMMEVMQQDLEPQALVDAVDDIRRKAIALEPIKPRSFADLCDDLLAELEYDLQNDDHRIKTGLPTIDSHLNGGIIGGWLVVVGARTGVGKTLFAVQVGHRAAKAGHRVIYVTIEESPTHIAERLVRHAKRVARTPSKRDYAPLVEATLSEEVRDTSIDVVTLSQLGSIVGYVSNQVMEREGVGLVVVDYAGLVYVGNYESKVQEISALTQQLKLLAMEQNIPVMLLAQVNRGPTSRSDKRPQLSDLKDSGSLEQDADAVIFLHHDNANVNDDAVILAKNRYGASGEIPATFNYPIGRIEEVSVTHGP